jgi:hypothetical protein
MNDFNKAAQTVADQIKAAVPEVKFNKNGYEIRTQMLEIAQNQMWNDYHSRWGQYEIAISKEKDGKVLTEVKMPEVPGVDKILEAAQKFYDFVNMKKF